MHCDRGRHPLRLVRIAIVNTNAEFAGGAETYLQALVPQLSDRGHELAIATERPIPGRRLPLDPGEHLDTVWDGAALGRRALTSAIAAWAPDVVFMNLIFDPGLESDLLDRFSCAIYQHTYHGTCVSGSKMHGFPTAVPRPLSAAPLRRVESRRHAPSLSPARTTT